MKHKKKKKNLDFYDHPLIKWYSNPNLENNLIIIFHQ
jgi:hypothetical protein